MEKRAGRVRAATRDDILIVQAWLETQDSDADSLYVNWKTTLEVFEKHGMMVYDDERTGKPNAYFWGSLSSANSILEVYAPHRGQGIGKAFVSYLVEQSIKSGEGLLQISCAPSTSIPFWKSVGFHVSSAPPFFATRVLRIPREVPFGGKPVHVAIRFFPGFSSTEEKAAYFPEARMDHSGVVWLSEKIADFTVEGRLDVQIEVNGVKVYHGSAASPQAEAVGVVSCINGFAIERINYTAS